MTPSANDTYPALRLLAVDTATARATVAVSVGEAVVAEAAAEVTTHSEGLIDLIAGALELAGITLADLDALVCGRGPGSFTGLRIGLATVKGLCFAAGKPLCCAPTMVGVAGAAAARHGARAQIAVVLDARRDEFFCGLFRGREPAGEEVVLRRDQLGGWLDGREARGEAVVVAGDGALRYREEPALSGLTLADEGCHQVQARHLAAFARQRIAAGEGFDDLALAVPTYLRPPDIRRPATPPPPTPAGLEPTPAAAPGPPTAAAGDALDDAERAALIERKRQTGLRLDREGRWWHLGQRVEHRRLARALHRWLDRLDDGRFILRLGEDRYAYVEVDDAPYTVRTLQPLAGTDDHAPVVLLLSDETEEPLDPESLVVDPESEALYCRVKQGRFEARLSRAAHFMLAQLIEEDRANEDSFVFVRGAVRAPIGTRPPRRGD